MADQNGDKTFQTIYVFAQINHPIVTTLQPVETAFGSIIMSGKLISTGGSTVMDEVSALMILPISLISKDFTGAGFKFLCSIF